MRKKYRYWLWHEKAFGPRLSSRAGMNQIVDATVRTDQARSVELPDQRGRNCLHVFRFVVEGNCWHAVDRELKIGRSIPGVTILVASVQSRKRGHRHLGAAADKSTTERVSRQC